MPGVLPARFVFVIPPTRKVSGVSYWMKFYVVRACRYFVSCSHIVPISLTYHMTGGRNVLEWHERLDECDPALHV